MQARLAPDLLLKCRSTPRRCTADFKAGPETMSLLLGCTAAHEKVDPFEYVTLMSQSAARRIRAGARLWFSYNDLAEAVGSVADRCRFAAAAEAGIDATIPLQTEARCRPFRTSIRGAAGRVIPPISGLAWGMSQPRQKRRFPFPKSCIILRILKQLDGKCQ